MEKIENATCIKFEDKNENQHKETVRNEIHPIFDWVQSLNSIKNVWTSDQL